MNVGAGRAAALMEELRKLQLASTTPVRVTQGQPTPSQGLPRGLPAGMMLDMSLVPDPPFVLIIDDDPLFLATACEAVREHGLAVRGVGTAVEGLEVLAEGHAPKLILLDLVLPGLGARDFLTMVKREVTLSRTPVVLVTALAAEDVPTDLPVDGVVLKPVVASQLESAVDRYCGRA